MAAEYEVNIKLNTQEIKTQLNEIDKAVKNIGKAAGGGSGGSRSTAGAGIAKQLSLLTADKIFGRGKITGTALKNVKLSWLAAFDEIQDVANAIGGKRSVRLLNVKSSWIKALGELQETAGVIKAKDARVKQSWAKALGQLEETAKDISSNRAVQRGKRRRQRLEQVGLGAGFPLLFGGGPGSVLGGAAGGLTGSFGAQIAFSAIGQQIDQFISGILNTGRAFGSLTQTLELMRERSLFTSKESEELARQLENLGDVEGLAELATIDLASKIGSEGIGAFQDLETEVDEFDRLVNNLSISLQAFLSGPLAGFLNIVNSVLGKKVTQGTVNRLAESLQDPAAQERFRAEARRQIGTELEITGFTGLGGLPQSQEVLKSAPLDLLSELARQVAAGDFGESSLTSRKVKITKQDRENIKPPKGRRGRAPRESRVPQLQIEVGLAERLSVLNGQILEAKKQEDFIRQNALEKEIALEQQAAKIALIGLEKIPKDEKELKVQKVILETKGQIRDIDFQLFEFERRRQELFDDTVADLEYQLELSQATSREERERLRIEKKLQELKDKGLKGSQLAEIEQLMKQISAENSPLSKFIKQSTESLNDLETFAVQVSQGIGNAIGNSLTNGLQNLISGAATVKDVFADMLKSVADVLLKQAAQMIATYIAIGVARAFAGLGGSSSSSTPDPFSANVASVLPDTGNLADVAASTPLALNAAGSYVSSPTATLVGEGGQGEYIIPESKMRESMARYSRGARGGAVIPETGESGTSGEGGGTAVAAPIDVRYSVERINNVDYVTAEQFQAGLTRAAQQGAAQGEQRTLRKLKMSPSSRRGVGF